MKLKLLFPLMLAAAFFPTQTWAQTNSPSTNTDAMANGYLQIQEQLHATRLAVEDARLTAAEDTKRTADAITARLETLEQSATAQRNADEDAARKTQQFTLMLAGAFGLAGLGIMVLMFYFQWRAFSQLAQISSQHNAALLNGGAVSQLTGPGRAAVEASNVRLLDVVGRLEQRIHELENGSRSLPEGAAKPAQSAKLARSADLLAEGQNLLDANQPQKALEMFEKILAVHPEHGETLVKMAAALEKMGRDEEALAVYNRAIAADGTLVIAHLHKGGMLNRLRRYDEALDCYEHALMAQDKKAAVQIS
jgi:tetratricopeptide (TPR) repeat protein